MPELETIEHNGIFWKEDDEESLCAFVKDERGKLKKVAWAPQPGSQEAMLACPVFEVLLQGPRGGGKTDTLIMDFAQHIGTGYRDNWNGILFRQTFPELEDVIRKTKHWFPLIWPNVKFNETKKTWTWTEGEELKLAHAKRNVDYWSFHGHAYSWMGWEELCTWADPSLYLRMMSLCRSPKKNMPRKYRATANPYGPGHNWVKDRWRLPMPSDSVIGPVIRDSHDREGNIEPPRVAIHSHLFENKVLLHGDPDYLQRLRSSASNEEELKAWIYGDWNIVAGGMFDDVWRTAVHVIPNIPWPKLIASGWKINRSYDDGQAKPFSVGWWAISNGEPIEHNGKLFGQVTGDIFRVAEWYGWNGRPNEGVRMLSTEIAQGILDREEDFGILGTVLSGPADSSIYNDYAPQQSVAGDMKSVGVKWTSADKSRGSRKQGWRQIRKLLKGAFPSDTGRREDPGMFILERCAQFQRTVPVLSRLDSDLDDVNTETEDHIGDETRYQVCRRNTSAIRKRWK